MLKTKSQQFTDSDVNSIKVETIDNFQGDENDIIIVSLVRSNEDGVTGFVNTLNRRCVAQSRARCAMYFVGNSETICSQKGKNPSVWKPLIDKMNRKGCVGNAIRVKCPNENHKKIMLVKTDSSLLSLVTNPALLCTESCGYIFGCLNSEHACTVKCKPNHHHGYCATIVKFIHAKCLHKDEKCCYENPEDLLCNMKVDFEYETCKHIVKKNCHVSQNAMPSCSKSCRRPMTYCRHACEKKCGSKHHHNNCKVEVKFNRKSCPHEGVKPCFQDECLTDCNIIVDKIMSSCSHIVEAECSKHEDNIKCPHLCNRQMKCGKHRCKKVCGEMHTHESCEEKVSFYYPKCGHQGQKEKKCSAAIDIQCTVLLVKKGKCGHSIQHQCFQSVADVKCQHPCERKLSPCGHLCSNICGESCTTEQCKTCQKDFKKELDLFRKEAQKRVQNIAGLDLSRNNNAVRRDIQKSGTSHAEYVKVEDQVMKSIKTSHNWYPTVTRIEKVINYNLELKFEKAKSKTFGYFVDEKFHGTSNEGVNGIIKEGFRIPGPPSFGMKPGMYGQGIYFATDSSKSAQTIYTKNSNQILLCKVLLGKSKVLQHACPTMCKETLNKGNFDSVHAPRGSAVQNDEFVVFDPDQALPIYIIHFSTSGIPSLPMIGSINSNVKPFERRRLQSSRAYNPADMNEKLYRIAESQYLKQASMRLAQTQTSQVKQSVIDNIDYVFNAELLSKFEKKKKDFKSRGIPDHEILAFHGTSPVNVDSILKQNLDPKRTPIHGSAYGQGVYFSEFPDFSLKYGKALILFRVLPGREHTFDTRQPATPLWHHSIKVNANTDGCGEQLVVKDSHQYVPYFVYNLK